MSDIDINDVFYKLFHRYPSDNDLCHLIQSKHLESEAAKELLERNPLNYYLRLIIKNVESVRQEAWEKLLERDFINAHLCLIIEQVEPLRQEAWKELIKRNPRNSYLAYIIDYIEPLRKEATEILQENLNNL